MIRMIAIDLDGTVLHSKSILPERNRIALKRAVDAGVKVVICTGRMVEATLPIAREIGVNAPISVFNGAMVYDPETNRVLGGHTIPKEITIALLKELEARGIYTHAFPGKGYYRHRHTAWTDYYADKCAVHGIPVDTLLSEWLDTDVYKLLALDESERLDELIEELSPLFPQLYIVKSGKWHLEFIMKGVDKGSGLLDICRLTGISPDEVLAFGDEANDIPLLQAAGEGYVMENATEAIRNQFSLVAPKNTDCGVAQIIEKYLAEGRMGGSI